ncbi:tyrosine-type recombinase/integrase [Micromonospora sp. L32]|uniref:tyrosine-type recombinase/integrase n=1 Tax=Micromonospora sp. L32 TaxID=3452214 RepID=UPI003F890765
MHEAGAPLHRNRFNKDVWLPARTAAGLPEATCHDLRHFYASALIGAGHSPKVVADRLGHSDPAMTLRVYSHLWPEDDDRTRQAIDDVFRRDVPTVRPSVGA